MALTHLPTRMSVYANQPLGFVSAAEGFIFLSAFLAGRSYSSALAPAAARQVRGRYFTRALKLYGYHLLLLLFAFSIAAAFAALTGRPALRNLLTFYFDAPIVALISGPLLLYQPPLFDILPMYIVFLLLTPLLLATTARRGWALVLGLSALAWAFAQLGGRRFVYETVVPAFGLNFPLEAAGSFDVFAWQFLWVAGLWAGNRLGAGVGRARARGPVLLSALAVAAVFLLWRHDVGGTWGALAPLWPALDKWELGILRLVNFAALAIVVSRLVVPLLAWVHLSVLAVLGRASLQVFAAHLVVCLASLGLIVDDDTPLSAAQEVIVLGVCVAVMVFVAKRTAARAQARLELRGRST
jgi:hypothetical protein